jgi:hydroxymethylbilane synthase
VLRELGAHDVGEDAPVAIRVPFDHRGRSLVAARLYAKDAHALARLLRLVYPARARKTGAVQQEWSRLQSKAPLLRIGTRGSALALRQAHLVRDLLARRHGVTEDEIAVVALTTSGDRLTDRPLSEVGGKGLFSKEIEEALAAGEIDLGVHSSKDLATVLPEGLEIAAFLEREDVRDAFVSLTAGSLDALPEGARLGTSSIRRGAQMLHARPDLVIVPFRGNVETRLRKLGDGVADATLLAVAGLNRLGASDRITTYLDPLAFPPAPAQGAIGVEVRADDIRTNALVAALSHRETTAAVEAERAMLAVLDGSCRTPVGAYSAISEGVLTLTGQILSPDGAEAFMVTRSGPMDERRTIGEAVALALLAEAGQDFLTRFASP